MQKLHLTFEVPPSVNNNYLKPRGVVKYIRNKPIAIVSMYETAEAKDYKKRFKKYIAEQIKEQGWKTNLSEDLFYIVESTVYFQKKGMDSNNHWKVPLDAVTETQLIWKDDSTVVERCKRIYYDSANPRVEYTIYIAENIGIFDSADDYNEYITRCLGCTWYKDGRCSVLVKAKESRIQENVIKIDGKWTCQKFKETKKPKKKG